MSERTFHGCRCPSCRMRLDDVSVDTAYCRHCGLELDASDVWRTRRYPGLLNLPRWLKALLPLGLTALGAVLLMTGSIRGSPIRRAPLTLMVFGVIGFVYVMLSGEEGE